MSGIWRARYQRWGALLPGSTGEAIIKYIRSGPEGAQGVLDFAALSLLETFFCSFVFYLWSVRSPGTPLVPWAWVGIPSVFLFFSNVLFTVCSHFSPPFLITCLMIFHVLGIPFSSMKFVSMFHRFWDGVLSHI